MSSFVNKFRRIKSSVKSNSTQINDQRAENHTTAVPTDAPDGSYLDSDQSSLPSMADGVFPSPILHMDCESFCLPQFPGAAVPDPSVEAEVELGSVECQKNIILHLLSQLKLGSNLTKVTLPTFILEKRSLLEMFADYLAHPDLFLRINRQTNPEDRMIAFVHWYLTAFHAGRKDKVAKKPYNPIIGETFHCCWVLPTHCSSQDESTPNEPCSQPHPHSNEAGGEPPLIISYCAEQVSHHPPTTAFHFECEAEQMELTGSIHTRSKYQGLSVSVSMIGKPTLRLGQHNEDYHFSLPSAYARSILSVPWVELGDKVTINCPQTGYSATVTFHTKPMRSNKLHHITAEIFAPQPVSAFTPGNGPFHANMVARFTGQWNGHISCERFTNDRSTWSIDVDKLSICSKHVYPIDQQRPEESRRLWQHVTSSLKIGDLHTATDHKLELEERQRVSEKYRVSHRILFPVKFFRRDGASWVFGSENKSVDGADG